MKKVLIEPANAVVQCVTNTPMANGSLVEMLGLPMACAGRGLCATCHVVVVRGSENLSDPDDRERRALARLTGSCEASRLSCQARVLGDVSVRLPDGIYVHSMAELTELIGRRAEKNILHPADGRILVQQGQIITRFVVRKLEGTSFQPWDALASSAEVRQKIV